MKTTSDMAHWITEQVEIHPQYDTLLDGVFRTEAWLKTACLFRQRFGSEKVSIVVDISTDNGQKKQVKIDSSNMDITQKLRFTLPVNKITYTVSGFGLVRIAIRQAYVEKQQQTTEPMPFQMTNEFVPMPWLSEITARTCLTYTPTVQEKKISQR